jgi:hypothetical protein
MKDQYLPPPFGDSRPSWIVNGSRYRERIDAMNAIRDAGMSAKEACDYVDMLMAEFHAREQVKLVINPAWLAAQEKP